MNLSVCSDSWKAEFIRTERKKLLNYKALLVKSLQPNVYVPFAGYFLEAHPSDRYIRETNVKNSAEDLNALINKLSPDIKTWTPRPGAVLDLGVALRGVALRGVALRGVALRDADGRWASTSWSLRPDVPTPKNTLPYPDQSGTAWYRAVQYVTERYSVV
ncbi:Cytidine monophosphate-N-acetylneuraminic acid hydroxylase [Liparis tanakae]|uniref:Cytidine monophosphate-N-acetylneuraminic acid hydroxylase n=1 Tax=Liparis tanakae TaxID=230148 RepID=A0A4Z2E3J9_9TELE|nr:Cytidine monophosphate-N-acetylneuraminic acid hydroxylase [Liparis tanakae]